MGKVCILPFSQLKRESTAGFDESQEKGWTVSLIRKSYGIGNFSVGAYFLRRKSKVFLNHPCLSGIR